MQAPNSQLNTSDGSAKDSAPITKKSLRKLPLWSKILIAMSGFTLVFIGYFLFRFADIFHDFAVNAVDPAKIAVIAREIATFKNPLPAGYSYQAAYSVGQKVLIIKHDGDNQLITFTCNPYLNEDAKKGLEHAEQQPLAGRAFFMPFSQEKSRGEVIVAGEKMAYIVGDFGSREVGEIVEGLIGCVSLKKENKTIFINALPGEGSSYNLKVTTDLLQSIEKF